MLSVLFLQWPLDEEGNLLRIQDFFLLEWAMRASPNVFQEGRNLFSDDVLADLLVIRSKPRKVLLVEEMAKGAMADIVQ